MAKEKRDPELALVDEDIQVEELSRDMCPNCDEKKVTHGIWVDFRTTGVRMQVHRGCRGCMEYLARRMRLAVPKAPPPS